MLLPLTNGKNTYTKNAIFITSNQESDTCLQDHFSAQYVEPGTSFDNPTSKTFYTVHHCFLNQTSSAVLPCD